MKVIASLCLKAASVHYWPPEAYHESKLIGKLSLLQRFTVGSQQIDPHRWLSGGKGNK